MQASVQRILALKEKWVDGMPEGGFDFDAARRENEALLQKTITEVHRPRRRAARTGERAAGASAARPTARRMWGMWMPARRTASATVWHGRCMAARRPCSRSPGREEIAALVELARRHTSAVVGTFNGRLRRGQLELVARLAEAGVPTVAGGAARPYDLAGLPESVWTLAAFEYTEQSIRAVGARAARRGRTNRKAARDFMSGEEKMPDMRYAAGMDGGGTKTVLEARAPDGRVLLRERFGPLNLNSAAAQAVRETMPGLYGCVGAPARRPGGLVPRCASAARASAIRRHARCWSKCCVGADTGARFF